MPSNTFIKFIKCFQTGKKKEDIFIDYISHTNPDFNIRPSSKEDDMINHIDGFITIKGVERGYDFKGIKSIKRGGVPRPDIQWLELDSGYENGGSLYGKQHYMVFEQEDCYLLFRRKDVLRFVLSKVQGQKDALLMPDTEAEIRMYQKYHRRERTDCVVLSSIKDMKEGLDFWRL